MTTLLELPLTPTTPTQRVTSLIAEVLRCQIHALENIAGTEEIRGELGRCRDAAVWLVSGDAEEALEVLTGKQLVMPPREPVAAPKSF